MGMQLWLAQVLRDAGLPVVEVSGWRTRSADEDADASTFRPQGLIIHETRGSATSTDAGEIGVLINGRVGLSGPIAQLYLSRTGTWHVVAAGLCHHVKTGWGGPFEGLGNSRLLGIEPAHAESESWSAKPQQYQSYVRGAAAIVKAMGWPPPVGHKEHQPGDKPDPEFNMTTFRADVAQAMTGGDMLLTDKLPSGVTVGGALDTLLARTNYLANVLGLAARLDAILAAALDDGDTTVVLAPEALAELTAVREAIAAVPQVTADLVHADLAD